MNNLETVKIINAKNQTPLEVVLEIDKDGRTTAKKLYKFLELDKSNYSRWCKKNIIENEFVEENIDYWAFVINDEWGGQSTTDYKLTASFAKKFAMSSHSPNGEQAREYFIKVENKLKELAQNKNLQLPSTYKEALKQLLIQVEENEKLSAEKLELETSKNRLETELDYNKQWYTIKRVAALNNITWRVFDWKKLKQKSYELGYGIQKIFDANYGYVNSYHYRVWQAVYPQYKI